MKIGGQRGVLKDSEEEGRSKGEEKGKCICCENWKVCGFADMVKLRHLQWDITWDCLRRP